MDAVMADPANWTSWRNKSRAASRSDETEKRAELWQAFCDFVRENRGWITSPFGSRVVLETERDSPLPQKLAKLGYAISEIPGSYERVTGAGPSLQDEILMRQGYAIDAPGPTMRVDKYEILLPWAGPPPPPMKGRADGR
jgi:hypothetical protein